MPSAQNKIQIVDTHETAETLAVTRLQRVGYQINRTLLIQHVFVAAGFGLIADLGNHLDFNAGA